MAGVAHPKMNFGRCYVASVGVDDGEFVRGLAGAAALRIFDACAFGPGNAASKAAGAATFLTGSDSTPGRSGRPPRRPSRDRHRAGRNPRRGR